jgi:uncharacterized protein (DUF2336 family)
MAETPQIAGDPPSPAAPSASVQDAGFARRALLRRLMDVVALPSSRGNLQDRAIAGDLLLEILIESDVSARELCARRLRDMSQAPKRLLRYLALDAPHVAQIILSDNKAFDDADLIHVAQHGGSQHRISVAVRRDLGPAVSTAIAESGDTVAMKMLLENTQAKLSERAVDLIVNASRKDANLPPLLIQREELRPAHALAMFWWSAAEERRHILLRCSAERTLLIEGCADIFAYAANEEWADPVVRKALQIIERRQRNRAAMAKSVHEGLEAAIASAEVTGMSRSLADDISTMSGIKPSTGHRIFLDRGGEGVAILCKATGLKREYLSALWASLRRTGPDAEAAFRRVSDIYESIAVAKAQTVLRYWNWSLSSAYTPDTGEGENSPEQDAPTAVAATSLDTSAA